MHTPAAGEVVGNGDIRLVPIDPNIDAQQIFELANEDVSYMRTFDLGTGYYNTLESTRSHLQDMYDKGLAFAIMVSGVMAGNIYITEGIEPELASLSYWVSKRYSKQGIGTQAVNQAIDFTFNNLGKGGLLAAAALTNAASRAILKKAGFVPIDIQELILEEGPVNIGVFGLVNPSLEDT